MRKFMALPTWILHTMCKLDYPVSIGFLGFLNDFTTVHGLLATVRRKKMLFSARLG